MIVFFCKKNKSIDTDKLGKRYKREYMPKTSKEKSLYETKTRPLYD